MSILILKPSLEHDLYVLWSTVCDNFASEPMTRAETVDFFADNYREGYTSNSYGNTSPEYVEQRLQHCDETGTSEMRRSGGSSGHLIHNCEGPRGVIWVDAEDFYNYTVEWFKNPVEAENKYGKDLED